MTWRFTAHRARTWRPAASPPSSRMVLVSIAPVLDPSESAAGGAHPGHASAPGNEPLDLWQGFERAVRRSHEKLKEERQRGLWRRLKAIAAACATAMTSFVGSPLWQQRCESRRRSASEARAGSRKPTRHRAHHGGVDADERWAVRGGAGNETLDARGRKPPIALAHGWSARASSRRFWKQCHCWTRWRRADRYVMRQHVVVKMTRRGGARARSFLFKTDSAVRSATGRVRASPHAAPARCPLTRARSPSSASRRRLSSSVGGSSRSSMGLMNSQRSSGGWRWRRRWSGPRPRGPPRRPPPWSRGARAGARRSAGPAGAAERGERQQKTEARAPQHAVAGGDADARGRGVAFARARAADASRTPAERLSSVPI